jgi:plasmid maintenance system antidote protein VapI
MTPKERKIFLLKKGITQAALAKWFGCTKSMICHLIAGRAKSNFLQLSIARRLKIGYEHFWGKE